MAKFILRTNAIRSIRKMIAAGVKAGTHTLRVVGSKAAGYRVAGEVNTRVIHNTDTGRTIKYVPVVTVFGPQFPTQAAAVAYGERTFNKTPKKLLTKQPAAAGV